MGSRPRRIKQREADQSFFCRALCGVGSSSRTRYTPSTKMRSLGAPEGYEWATRSLLGQPAVSVSRSSKDARGGVFVNRGVFVVRSCHLPHVSPLPALPPPTRPAPGTTLIRDATA